MSFLELALLLDKTKPGINSIFAASVNLTDNATGDLCPGGLCPGGVSVQGGLFQGPPPTVTCGRYASYWNAS